MYTKNTIDLYNGRVVEHRRGGGTQEVFIRRVSAPEVQSLPFYMPFLT